MTFRRTRVATAALLALGGGVLVIPAAHAQQTERIEITGSAIKRVDAETAVPVTIIKAEELRTQGVTTIEQVMAKLSSVQMSTGTSQVVGSGSGGASFADLRGIGANKTLVLLNGRRIANNAYDSSAPDLNMIPFAAIERVEVLRDGASALYGTDAVGGVINFITNKNFRGGALTLGIDRPEGPGGRGKNANFGFGFGDLTSDKFNVWGFVDRSSTERIGGTDRDYNARQPGGLSPTPFPANYFQDGDPGNPAAPDCADPTFLIPTGDGTSCTIKTSEFVNYTPQVSRTSAMVKGTVALGSDHSFSLEWFGTQAKSESVIAPVPYGSLWMNRLRPDGSLNPFYPGNTPGSITPNIPLNPNYTQANMTPRPGVVLQPGFITVRWRDLAHGSRTDISENKQNRVVAQMEGIVGGWDYQVAASYNENKIAQNLRGYSDGNRITQGMLNGVLNPFGPQDAAGQALIDATSLAGNLQNARGKVTGVDGKVSGSLGNWFGGGESSLAVGGEFRKEDFFQAANTPFAELVQASTGIDPNSFSKGERKVTALYAELSVPLAKSLEVTAAIRHDRYDDFGNTTNPKFTLRYQPISNLVARATYSTGFRAPSLYDINALPAYTNTSTVDDPINCPSDIDGDGRNDPIPGKQRLLNCQVQFQALFGGNADLKPEKAKNLTLGLVIEPTQNLSMGFDLWWVQLRQAIGSLSEETVFADPATYASVFRRNASGDLSTDGFSCPGTSCGYLDLRTLNLGGIHTSGVDISLSYRTPVGAFGQVNMGLNSTWVRKYDYQDIEGGPWNQNVGVYVGAGPIFRWQHSANVAWTLGDWTIGWVGRYKSGYVDQDPSNEVSSYGTMDANLTWSPSAIKGAYVTAGITNIADRDPPFSNQGEVFQANYDPRFTDPTGRSYYLRLGYRF